MQRSKGDVEYYYHTYYRDEAGGRRTSSRKARSVVAPPRTETVDVGAADGQPAGDLNDRKDLTAQR